MQNHSFRSKFKGKALYFFRIFFLETLLPLIRETKPQTGQQVTELIIKHYSKGCHSLSTTRYRINCVTAKNSNKYKQTCFVSLFALVTLNNTCRCQICYGTINFESTDFIAIKMFTDFSVLDVFLE